MKISIVIPAFNEERLLADTLRHVQAARAAFIRAQWESELIVCDNNSTDRTAEIARAGCATVVFEPINQIARARNCGGAAATGDWLLFVDADSSPTAELFADVVEQIKSGQCLAGGTTIRLEHGYPIVGLVTKCWNLISRWKHLVAGSFIFCETAGFRRLGGFSNDLFAGEEIEFSNRLKKLARETKRKVVILHRHPMETSARKMRLYKTSELWAFFVRAAFNQKKVLTNRDACGPWYDGRR